MEAKNAKGRAVLGNILDAGAAAQHEKQAAAWQAQQQQLDTQVGILTKQYAYIVADYKALADLLAKA